MDETVLELDTSQPIDDYETSEIEHQPTDKERKEQTNDGENGMIDKKTPELDTSQPTDDKETSELEHQATDKEKDCEHNESNIIRNDTMDEKKS